MKIQKTMNNKINIELASLDETQPPQEENEIKKKAEKILENLLKMSEIQKGSPIFNYEFNTLNFELSFCNDETIHQINKEYRQKDRPTDVITFALFCDDKNSIMYDNTIELGEIIISTQTLERQAQENNHSKEREMYTLITHGILHLLGFDHLEQKDYDFVVSVQNKIVENL